MAGGFFTRFSFPASSLAGDFPGDRVTGPDRVGVFAAILSSGHSGHSRTAEFCKSGARLRSADSPELKAAVPPGFQEAEEHCQGHGRGKGFRIPRDIAVKIIQKLRGVFSPKTPLNRLADFYPAGVGEDDASAPGILSTLGLMGVYFVVLVVPMGFLCVVMYESTTERGS